MQYHLVVTSGATRLLSWRSKQVSLPVAVLVVLFVVAAFIFARGQK